jgi:hypothetical protein
MLSRLSKLSCGYTLCLVREEMKADSVMLVAKESSAAASYGLRKSYVTVRGGLSTAVRSIQVAQKCDSANVTFELNLGESIDDR